MPVTVGLQNVGSFQVAGWPYMNTATLDSSEQEFKFNFISQEITVWNAGGEELKFYFTSGSGRVFILPPAKKVTLRVKAGSIFALSELPTQIKLFVSMTNIPLERIGVIPTGSYFGPIPDIDGDGVPDYQEEPLLRTFGGEYDGDNEAPFGDPELWMEYDDGGGGVLVYNHGEERAEVPNTLYLLSCPGSITDSDLDPVMQNLSAFYEDDSGVTQSLAVPYPDLSLIDLINKKNQDQYIPVTVERSVLGGDTISVTVHIIVHQVCEVEGVQTTGIDLEGETGDEEYDFPTNTSEVPTSPEDYNMQLNETTTE